MATASDSPDRAHARTMRLAVVRQGDTVTTEGTVVHLRDGAVLLPDDHWADWLLTADDRHVDDLRGTDLDLAVPLHVTSPTTVRHRASVTVTGRWSGSGVEVQQVAPRRTALKAGTRTSARPHLGRLRRPPGAPGPPTALEEELLADGTLTARMPHGDGTLEVVADDVDLATRLLGPLYGDALRVRRAVYSQAQRRVARAALDAADEVAAVCAVGSGPLDDSLPAEQVHARGVLRVTAELAEVLARAAEGLLRVESHVRLADPLERS